MMDRLIERGERIGAVRRENLAQRLAATADLPGDVAVTVEEAGVVLSGRRLGARMLSDARLRWIGR